MKTIKLLLLMLLVITECYLAKAQTTYFARNTTNLHLAANWNSVADGSGTAPTNFTNALDIFEIDDEVGTVTIGANWTVAGNVQVGNGTNAVNLSTNGFTISGTFNVGNTATLSVNTNSTFTIGTLAAGSTVSYNGDLAQSVRAGTYDNLTLTNATAARLKTASGIILVNGALVIDNNNTLVLGANTLSGTLTSTSGTGIITTINTTANPLPDGKTWTQTVQFNGTVAHIIPNGTYENLTIGGSTDIKTANGNIVVNGILNVVATNTLAMTSFTLSGAFTNVGTGTISTANTSATPFPSGVTWTQTVSYLAGTTTVRTGTYQILSVTGAGTRATDGDITVNGTLTVTTGTLDLGTNLLIGAFTPSSTGTIQTANTSATPIPVGKTWTQTLAYNSASSQTVVHGTYAALNTTGGDRVFSSADSIRITGTFTTGSGALDFTGTSIALRGGTQAITITGQTAITFNNLSVSVSGTKTFTGIAATITVNGVLNIPSPVTHVLALATNKLVLGMGATLTGGGTLTTTCVLADPLPSGKIWPYTVTYSATASNSVASGTYLNLNISGGGTATANGDITVTNNLAVTGAFALSTFRLLSVGGTITNTSTISTAYTAGVDALPTGKTWPTTVSYIAAGNQTIVDGTYTNLSVSGGGSFVKSAIANLTVTGTLTTAATTILDLATFQLLSTTTITNTGTIRTQNTSATPLIASKTYAGTIEYNGGSNQTVVNATYTNLNLTGGDRTISSSDTIKISGTFTMGAGTYTTTGSIVALNGTTTQTINSGGQTFNNFAIILGTVKTVALAGFNVDGNLHVSSGATLTMATFQLGGIIASTSGSGTISTTNTGLTPIPSGESWTQTVNYAASFQTVVGGTYNNLTLSGNSVTKTASGDIAITNNLTSVGNANTILFMGTHQLTGIAGTISGVGQVNTQNVLATPIPVGKTWTQTVLYSSAATQTVVDGSYLALNVAGGDRTFSSAANINIAGLFTANTGAAVYTTTGSNILFTSVAAQTLTLAANFTFDNVFFTGGNTKTIGVSISVNGVINIASGVTVNIGANTLSGATLTTSGTGLLRTQNVSATPIPTLKIWTFRVQFDVINNNQTIPVGVYSGGLYMSATSGIRTRTLAGSITVSDTLSIGSTFTTLDLDGNTLIINGIINPAETGTITGSVASSITIGSNANDAGTLNMNQTSTATRSLNNLTLSRATGADAIILGNELRLINALTLTDGTLASNGNLVFVSSGIATSAQLDAVTGSGNVSGNVVVQRFIDGQPVSTNVRWRFLASSVTTSNGIDDNWQQQMFITGAGLGGTLCPSVTANSNGFDATATNNASFFTRNAATDAWVALPNTNATQLQTGIGYRVFYRGSRSQKCDSIFAGTLNPSDTTLVATGTLAIGTQMLTGGAAANRYALVGNPFQATIDLESPGISLTNLSNTLSSFRPNTAGGTYGYYTIGGIGVNGMTRYISPGQSFWIQTIVAAASSMSVAESAKTIAQGGFAYFKTQPAEQNVLRIKLFKSSSTEYLDEVAVVQKANSNWSYNVAEEPMKIGFSTDQIQLYTPDASTKYAICVVPGFDVLHNKIHIDAKTIVGNDYSLNFTGVTSFDATLGFTLYDTYLGTTQDLRLNPVYSFATPDAASILATRFYILFDPNAIPLPVNLIAFKGERTSQNQTALTWKTASEQGSDRFEIERSIDAQTFVKIGVTKAAKQSSKVVNYMFTDISPVLSSTNYYRLKQVDANGEFAYSQLVSVSYKQAPTLSAANVSVYPVPANDVLVVEVKDIQLLQNATIKLYDLFGKELSLPIEYVTGKWTIQTTELNKGMYIISLLNNGAITQFKVLKD